MAAPILQVSYIEKLPRGRHSGPPLAPQSSAVSGPFPSSLRLLYKSLLWVSDPSPHVFGLAPFECSEARRAEPSRVIVNPERHLQSPPWYRDLRSSARQQACRMTSCSIVPSVHPCCLFFRPHLPRYCRPSADRGLRGLILPWSDSTEVWHRLRNVFFPFPSTKPSLFCLFAPFSFLLR